jgi:hypothetical protein
MQASFENIRDDPRGASRHVGSPLFAFIVCRKFAIEAAMFWHLSFGI